MPPPGVGVTFIRVIRLFSTTYTTGSVGKETLRPVGGIGGILRTDRFMVAVCLPVTCIVPCTAFVFSIATRLRVLNIKSGMPALRPRIRSRNWPFSSVSGSQPPKKKLLSIAAAAASKLFASNAAINDVTISITFIQVLLGKYLRRMYLAKIRMKGKNRITAKGGEGKLSRNIPPCTNVLAVLEISNES